MKKKILFSSLLLLGFFLLMPSVYAGEFTCSALGDDLLIDDQIADIVHLVILLIQIAVPILLVVFGMIDLMKGVMSQKEDEIKAGQKTFIKRLLAAVIVFFVIAVVKLVISAVASNSEGIMACVNCFLEGSDSESCLAASTSSPDSDDSTDTIEPEEN